MESDDEIERIPEPLRDNGGMACLGDRCRALTGEVGRWTGCSVYPVRPIVCRDCEPGDPECLIARARHGLTTA